RISTVLAPGGRTSLPAVPQVTTTRWGGSTTTYSPRTGTPLMSTTNLPPAVASSSAQSPIQRTMSAASVRYGNTSAGRASIRTDVVKTSLTVDDAGRPRPPA